MALYEMPQADRSASVNTAAFRHRLTLANISGGGTIAFPPGRYRIKGFFRVLSNTALWFAKGATLSIQGKLDIRGPIFAGAHQIFDASSTTNGSPTSNVFLQTHGADRQSISDILPEWWGAGLGSDTGQGIAAMAHSILDGGRFTIAFRHRIYLAVHARFGPGHRFVAPNGCVIRSRDNDQSMISIIHTGLHAAPRTTFQNIQFFGPPPTESPVLEN